MKAHERNNPWTFQRCDRRKSICRRTTSEETRSRIMYGCLGAERSSFHSTFSHLTAAGIHVQPCKSDDPASLEDGPAWHAP
jgi:hypothetical protein